VIVKCFYIIPALRDGSLLQPAGVEHHFLIIIKANLMMQNYKNQLRLARLVHFLWITVCIRCIYKTFSSDCHLLFPMTTSHQTH